LFVGLVGGLNTLVDLLILNGLLWLFPTTSSLTLLVYSSLAYSLGAVNSFLLNKYWTFGKKHGLRRAVRSS
jgi:putative flippase GtrA